MGSELPIRLISIGGRAIGPPTINADPAVFVVDETIRIADQPDAYIVRSKQLTIDSTGRPSVIVTVKSTRTWFAGLDAFAEKHDIVYPLLGMLFLFAGGSVVTGFFLFLSASDATKMAYAGYAIACAPWVLLIGAIAGLSVLSVRLQKTIGQALGVAVGFSGCAVGLALSSLWRWLFLPQPPSKWPSDYVQLATDFSHHAASLTAVGAVYAPLVLLILKILHLDFIGTIASIFVKKKSARDE